MIIVRKSLAISLTEKADTWEDFVELLHKSRIDSLEIYSKSGSYAFLKFGGQGGVTTLNKRSKLGFHVEAFPNRFTVYGESVRKVEHDWQGWNIFLTNGDIWRIHIY